MSTTSDKQPIQPFGDNFIPVIPTDYPLHTDTYPFCVDPSCSCHDDPLLIAPIHQAYLNGELTAQEATNIVMGKHI